MNADVPSLASLAFSIGFPLAASSTTSAGKKDVPVGLPVRSSTVSNKVFALASVENNAEDECDVPYARSLRDTEDLNDAIDTKALEHAESSVALPMHTSINLESSDLILSTSYLNASGCRLFAQCWNSEKKGTCLFENCLLMEKDNVTLRPQGRLCRTRSRIVMGKCRTLGRLPGHVMFPESSMVSFFRTLGQYHLEFKNIICTFKTVEFERKIETTKRWLFSLHSYSKWKLGSLHQL